VRVLRASFAGNVEAGAQVTSRNEEASIMRRHGFAIPQVRGIADLAVNGG